MTHWSAYARLCRHARGKLTLAIGLALLEVAALLPVPIAIRSVFDVALQGGSPRRIGMLVLLLAILRIAAVIFALATRHLSLTVTKSLVERMREQLYEKFLTMPYPVYRARDAASAHTLMVQATRGFGTA